MIPINIISKLARSRSHIVLTRAPIMTSGKLWSRKSGSKDDDGSQCGEGGVKKQYDPSYVGEEQEYLKRMKQGEGNSCGEFRDKDREMKDRLPHRSTGLGDSNCTNGKDESQSSRTKSRGYSCPPYATPKNAEIKTSNYPEPKTNVKSGAKCEEERKKVDPCDQRKQKEGHKCEKERTDDHCDTHFNKKKTTSSPATCDNLRKSNTCVNKSSQKNKDISHRCDTPKNSDFCDKGISREKIDSADCYGTQKINYPCDKQTSRNSSPPEKCEKHKRSAYRCETEEIGAPCDKDIYGRKPFSSDFCGPKKNYEPCDTSHPFMNYSEKDRCSKNKGTNCEPKKSPREEECEEPKLGCSNNTRKQKSEDPCEVKMFNFKTEGIKEPECTDSNTTKQKEQCTDFCDEKTESCEPRKYFSVICPQNRDECDKKAPCKTSNELTNDCTKVKKDVCCEEEKSDCTRNPVKEIKIPELAPCCKVDAAKECLCKLRQLQKQWEEVIAAQENDWNRTKVDCPQESRSMPAKKIHRRSNMIYIVLSAILGAVMYYIYNGDFEPEQLFLEGEQEKEGETDDEN